MSDAVELIAGAVDAGEAISSAFTQAATNKTRKWLRGLGAKPERADALAEEVAARTGGAIAAERPDDAVVLILHHEGRVAVFSHRLFEAAGAIAEAEAQCVDWLGFIGATLLEIGERHLAEISGGARRGRA